MGKPRWYNEAACIGADLEEFFSISGEQRPAVIDVYCAQCPVRPECLQFALDTHNYHGVWGGTTPAERKRERDRRRRGARAA
jgi:WhiB family transcriptional regulator, redox-sensing transcriptional regulator